VAYAQSDLDAIRTAIARGEKTVQFADRSVTYRDVSELLAAEARIARALDGASSSPRPSKQTLLTSSKGFCR
jgi:hypothetical protein